MVVTILTPLNLTQFSLIRRTCRANSITPRSSTGRPYPPSRRIFCIFDKHMGSSTTCRPKQTWFGAATMRIRVRARVNRDLFSQKALESSECNVFRSVLHNRSKLFQSPPPTEKGVPQQRLYILVVLQSAPEKFGTKTRTRGAADGCMMR